MLPASFGLGVADALAGMESLLGGLALVDLSLPEKSRTPTLLLTLGVLTPLKMKVTILVTYTLISQFRQTHTHTQATYFMLPWEETVQTGKQ